MHPDRLVNFPRNAISLDTETYAFTPGNKAPPLVLGSVGWLGEGPSIKGDILTKDEVLELVKEVAADKDRILVGANIAMFDLLVIAMEFVRRGIDIMPDIYRLLEEGRVFDILLAEQLHAIAHGHLGKDPKTGAPLKNRETGRKGGYSLDNVTELNLGRVDAKANDEFRKRYGEFDNKPLSELPPAAIQYPIDDAKNTHEDALAQTGHWPKVIPFHEWGVEGTCINCGATKMGGTCTVRRPHSNLHDLSNQVYTAFALHMGAARGFRVNQASVDVIERHAIKRREDGIKPFIDAGIIRDDGTEDQALIRRMVAMAYGAKDPCPVCKGDGKVPAPGQKPLRCTDCKGRCKPWKWKEELRAPTVAHCKTCNNTGEIPHPNPKMIGCIRVNEDGSKEKTCDGTGLVLTEDIPRTEGEGVGKGRDALTESGDEFLMSYGYFLRDAKDLKDYIPYLREARVKVGDLWKDIPLTLRPNPILETGRVSYHGYIQLFKRAPGFFEEYEGVREYVPSFRECIEARDGYVFASVDFDSGELITHAQSCLYIVGDSKLAEALNKGFKVHNALGATMLGLSYDEFAKRMEAKDRTCKDARQAAKPGNFGFPGGMGPVKMVLQQRKQGPDTPHPSGPHMVQDDNGNLVPGYYGLRFCILMNNAKACGIRKVTRFREQTFAPTCMECIECAIRLRAMWLKQWPENSQYFKFINECLDQGMPITEEALQRWPHLRPIFAPGRLQPGQIMAHYSGRIRGGLDYASCANSFFQILLGDAAKAAVRQISRECYDRTYRVPQYMHENSLPSKYARLQSPLYGSHLIAFQHDEVLPEIPKSIMHDAAIRISEVMVNKLRLYCPDLAPAVKAPPALMPRWLKQAEPFWLRGGEKGPFDGKSIFETEDRLIPWVPKHERN